MPGRAPYDVVRCPAGIVRDQPDTVRCPAILREFSRATMDKFIQKFAINLPKKQVVKYKK